MTTTTSILRVKTLRKLGASLWPWRKLNAKQTDLVDKSIKGQRKQVSLLQRKKKKSQFAYQLKAKQLLSTLYGNLNTKYLKTLFQKCKKIQGKQSVNFLTTLEKRLDCILYRASFAPSLQAAKQLITHKRVCVNQILISKPGYIVQPGDIISLAPESTQKHAEKMHAFLQATPTQTAFQTVSQRFIKRVAKLQTMQSKQNDSLSGFENKAVKKVFYKPLHLEINYQTLHIIYLFAPQQLYFPVALPLQHISRVFQR